MATEKPQATFSDPQEHLAADGVVVKKFFPKCLLQKQLHKVCKSTSAQARGIVRKILWPDETKIMLIDQNNKRHVWGKTQNSMRRTYCLL